MLWASNGARSDYYHVRLPTLVASPLSANQRAHSNSRCQQTSGGAKLLKKVLLSHIEGAGTATVSPLIQWNIAGSEISPAKKVLHSHIDRNLPTLSVWLRFFCKTPRPRAYKFLDQFRGKRTELSVSIFNSPLDKKHTKCECCSFELLFLSVECYNLLSRVEIRNQLSS